MLTTVWPITPKVSPIDGLLMRLKRYPGFCNICGRVTIFNTRESNLREHVPCRYCQSVNRYRQIMLVLLREAGVSRRRASIRDLPAGLAIWNAENTRALHEKLRQHSGLRYTSSEFIGPTFQSGTTVDGVMHVDMQATHFADASLDYVLSSDVMEHVPDYRQALREVYRILKVGGAYIFTAPFYSHRASIERRSSLSADGSLRHARNPWFHGDPLRPDGVLCFQVFGIEILSEMENIGYQAQLLHLHDPHLGILGNNGFVFLGRKVSPAPKDVDIIFNEVHRGDEPPLSLMRPS